MTRQTRRRFLEALGTVSLTATTVSTGARTRQGSQFAVEQGDRCIPVEPLETDETAAAFYDYRAPFTSPAAPTYSSHGTTALQRSETSALFLLRASDGLALVVVHDRLDDGTGGGAASFGFEGLASDGEWVVRDDDYDAPSSYDEFSVSGASARIDWTWGQSRTDGAVFLGLGEQFSVRITPQFNERAALFGRHFEGRVTDWQVVSGDRPSPDRTALALDRPITVRSGGCGGSAGDGATGGGRAGES